MSKGSKIVPVRIDQDLMAEIELAIGSKNLHSRDEQDSLSSWIRRCVREKLNHLARSRRRKKPQEYRCVSCGQPVEAEVDPSNKDCPDELVLYKCIMCIIEEAERISPPLMDQ